MRRAHKHLVLFALVSLVAGLGMTASQTDTSLAQTADPRPNIIFIVTDDMRYDDLQHMPATTNLAGQGMSFNNAFVSTPLCCPSRATIMRGQYAHNTDIWTNVNRFDRKGRDGGWEGYRRNGYERNNVATNLAGAGYRTGFFGKYLNGYSGTSKPPGWDDWFAFLQDRYYDYDVNDNGTTTHFGTSESAYSTDVLKGQTLQFIDDSVGAGKPFFAYVAPKAPHGPFRGTIPRHETDFDGATAPQSGSFNEEDVSDKPPFIQSLPPLTSEDIAAINNTYERRLESLQPVDDLVADVAGKLRDEGVLSNTYIVFTSDNGFYLGQHRIQRGKARPYEEAPHVPLVISGPGVQAGSTDKLVLNTDYFPTFMDIAGAPTPSYVDGRSLQPLLEGSATTTWRTAILVEGRGNRQDPEIPVDRNYNAIRTSSSKYVEYEGDIREYYDLGKDPDEMTNTYNSMAGSPLVSDLQAKLAALKQCKGTGPSPPSCEAAEGM